MEFAIAGLSRPAAAADSGDAGPAVASDDECSSSAFALAWVDAGVGMVGYGSGRRWLRARRGWDVVVDVELAGRVMAMAVELGGDGEKWWSPWLVLKYGG